MGTRRDVAPLLPNSQESGDILFAGETIAFFAPERHDAHAIERWVMAAITQSGALANWHYGWHGALAGAFIVCLDSKTNKQRLYTALEKSRKGPKGTLYPLGSIVPITIAAE